MTNAVKLRKIAPSPAGEGWGEENQNKEKCLQIPPHPRGRSHLSQIKMLARLSRVI